ncbi:cytochrome P450 2D3-like [Dendronephthya gigantea]|uniref:cytochrome P450 2D3-like n=1 Tax=Dendronephthya gigantea TaxID=151771 RepID=UPI00106BB64A|nr:cytochrome P450 2D3-like [Dendronephthya gigantea]
MIVETVFSLFLVWFAWYAVNTYTKRRNMPPGPFPYPFLGNLPQIIAADPVMPFTELAKKYGDIYTLTLPDGRDGVVLNTASLARDARRAGRQEDLAGRSEKISDPWRKMFGKDVLTSDYSSEFRFRKRVLLSALHVFGPAIEQVTDRARHAVDTMVEEIESKPGHAFSPKELMESAILVQLWKWLTSKDVSLNDPTVKKLAEFAELFAKQAILNPVFQLFPFLTYLPTSFSRDFPPEYRVHRESYCPSVLRDLTDSFISAYEKEISKENSKDVGSIDDIPYLMLNVAMGGSETTSSSLTWFFLFIVLHPHVQTRIQEELNEIVGRDRLPRWADLPNLPYLQATLCETQRASNVIPVVTTDAYRDTTIAGYHIPKGTSIYLNLSKIHHDEREWVEPDEFRPKRFLDSDGKFVGWNKLHSFLPFGVGRRECPGPSLAKVMMFTFASVLLHRYNFLLPDGAERPTTKVSFPAAILRPNYYQIVAKQRSFRIS